MIVAVVALAASALLGFAMGFVFRAWIHLIVAPLIAVGSAVVFAFFGFGFFKGAVATFACLFANQLAYFIALLLVAPEVVRRRLSHDVVDGQPGEKGE